MRKMIMAALAVTTLVPAIAIPLAAQAQSAREVRESQRELRRDEQQLRHAQRYGDQRDVRDARRDVRDSRREVREDWRDYRNSNRNAFHRPAYAGPRGYAYRPVNVGHRFQPAYYGNQYWVRDYRNYRLPAPPRNARWVRYGNDIVMVDTRSGRVMQVYNQFFW